VAAPSSGDGSSAPRLIEDQVRILVRALDENDQDTVVTGALDERRPWSAGADASDASDVMRYAAELRRLTAGQPADSPYTALADSAFEVAAAIVAHRPGRAPAPGSTDRAEISPVRPDRARPSCPPSR
jgi:hypothetical protein